VVARFPFFGEMRQKLFNWPDAPLSLEIRLGEFAISAAGAPQAWLETKETRRDAALAAFCGS